MNILAIESSCDETAAAVVKDGREILSNIVASQIETHKLYGGVVPEIASRMHIETIEKVVGEALNSAGMSADDIDAVAVTYAPGLIGALLVGVNFAKAFAYANNLPLIPVHHIKGHIAANFLEYSELEPPFLSLVVSGGHTHLIKVTEYDKFRIIGQTRDDAAGEAFDKAARVLSLPYPGGVHIDRLSKNGDIKAVNFPKTHFRDNEFDFSFSGLKTSVINYVHNLQQKNHILSEQERADIAASFSYSVASVLCTHTESAAKKLGCKKIVLAGGVSANSMIRSMMEEMCRKNGFNLYKPPLALCGDNAAMIGAMAYYEYKNGKTSDMSLNARANMSIEI